MKEITMLLLLLFELKRGRTERTDSLGRFPLKKLCYTQLNIWNSIYRRESIYMFIRYGC